MMNSKRRTKNRNKQEDKDKKDYKSMKTMQNGPIVIAMTTG